ncbi:Protein TPX2 [Morella rubra]|uniref:Protein TPX2 n=1 Tax=Morella rubra TaxID=262757 RepID=A0A6A1VD77_9ROSI|nr:Protein TPX2 [Morella rubra]
MEEDMEEFVREPSAAEEIDLDYEFDAARFYDFTRPETYLEAREAELWFESAPNHPPSPFMVKLKWVKDVPAGHMSTVAKSRNDEDLNTTGKTSDSCMCSEVSAKHETTKGIGFDNQMADASPKAKSKSPVKSALARNPTFMKPTASHLAKQNKPREVHSTRFLRFPEKVEGIDEKSSRSSMGLDSQATKRQKLDTGYLQKYSVVKVYLSHNSLIHNFPKQVAYLKHQALFLHKVGTTDINSVHTRLEVTIPREPDLATARRAERHRSKLNTDLVERVNSNAHTFKARPLNRKILEAPSLPLPKKSIPQQRELKVFHLKTSQRALQNMPSNVGHKAGNIFSSKSLSPNENTDNRSLNSIDALKQENCETVTTVQTWPHEKILSRKGGFDAFGNSNREAALPMEFNVSTQKRYPYDAPIESFWKLSLASDGQHNRKSQPKMPLPTKVLKENTPAPFHQGHENIQVVDDKLGQMKLQRLGWK